MIVSDSVFIVTGGSSGLGGATAKLLVESGATVVIADINAELGESLASRLGNKSARFVQTDVTDEASVKAAVNLAVREFGRLDGAINCAGIGLAQRTVGKDGPHSLESFTRVITVNLIGTFNVIRLAAAAMTAPRARIVWTARSNYQHCIDCRVRWSDRTGRLFGFEGRNCWYDSAHCARPCAIGNSSRDDSSRHLRNTASRIVA